VEQILANALGQDVSKIAAEEKRLLLSRLLARFAHEVRNPLSSIDIHVQLLEEDLAEDGMRMRERTAGRFEVIHGELHRLNTIVNHFLSLAGSSGLDLHPADVTKILGHVCKLLRPEAATRGITLEVITPGDIPPIAADSSQLTQAFLNLVINAIQAVDRDGVVRMEALADQERDSIQIEVRDSGPGIPADKQAAIFDPFFTTKAEGSGLGLWIVQQIINAHGGTVEAANSREGGAVLTVRLPRNRKMSDG
jgi:signal transduction histidine kinase